MSTTVSHTIVSRTTVSRHFATLGCAQIHYRRAGAGPVVLLLHQSPSSSAELVPLIERLADRFTAIAPDMPGYGASDPPPGASISIASLADNVAAFMDELGIGTAAVYGFHTGASIALSMARRHPGRLTVAVCEGLLCLDAAERFEFESRYIEPFVPRFDGSHLAWLWTRIKDQSLFFPWYERHAGGRLSLDGTPVPVLARRVEDWLRAGERYGMGYAAAFAYDPRVDLPFIDVPLVVQCHRHDPLAAHLPRLTPLPATAQVRCFGTTEQGYDLMRGALLSHAGDRPAPPVVAPRPLHDRVWQDYVVSHGIPLRVLRSGTGDGHAGDRHAGAGRVGAGRPIVLQHAAQSSAQACREWLAALGAQRPALAIEFPGHGETDGHGQSDGQCEPEGRGEPASPAGDALERLECLAEFVKGALDALGMIDCDLIGWGAGAAVQVEMARHSPTLANSLTLIAALDVTGDPALQATLAASYTAPAADSHGGYLLRAWHEARDHLLFFPWYERRRAFALADSPCLEPAFVQERAVDALLAGATGVALRRAEIGYPLRARLRDLRVTPRHAAPAWEPRHAHSRGLAASAAEFMTLSRDPARALHDLAAAWRDTPRGTPKDLPGGRNHPSFRQSEPS